MATPISDRLVAISRLALPLFLLLSLTFFSFELLSESASDYSHEHLTQALSASALKSLAMAVMDDDLGKKSGNGPLSMLIAVVSKMHFIVGLGMFFFRRPYGSRERSY
jgi:hypothetical protein